MNPYTHFYLYAKGWYEKKDIHKDLMKILSEYTNVEVKHLQNNDLRTVLNEIAWKHVNDEYSFSKFVSDVETRGYERAIISLLLMLAIPDLGEPDSNVLPMSEDAKGVDLSEYNFSKIT